MLSLSGCLMSFNYFVRFMSFIVNVFSSWRFFFDDIQTLIETKLLQTIADAAVSRQWYCCWSYKCIIVFLIKFLPQNVATTRWDPNQSIYISIAETTSYRTKKMFLTKTLQTLMRAVNVWGDACRTFYLHYKVGSLEVTATTWLLNIKIINFYGSTLLPGVKGFVWYRT